MFIDNVFELRNTVLFELCHNRKFSEYSMSVSKIVEKIRHSLDCHFFASWNMYGATNLTVRAISYRFYQSVIGTYMPIGEFIYATFHNNVIFFVFVVVVVLAR